MHDVDYVLAAPLFNVRMFRIYCPVNQSGHNGNMGHLIFNHNLVGIQTSNWTAFHLLLTVKNIDIFLHNLIKHIQNK